jgi:deoxyxylulose-5-phosphate synthase
MSIIINLHYHTTPDFSHQNRKSLIQMNLLITSIGKEELLRTVLGKTVLLLAIGLNMHSGRKVKKKLQGTESFKFIFYLMH